jgi:hypothetical protein
MNCRPGDLAIRVVAYPDSHIPIGSIVKVICAIGSGPTRGKTLTRFTHDRWKVDFHGDDFCAIPDAHLHPIRDQPGADETLTWSPVPATKQREAA